MFGCVKTLTLKVYEEIKKNSLVKSTSKVRDIIPFTVILKTALEKIVFGKSETIEQSTSLFEDDEKRKGKISYLTQIMKAEIFRRFTNIENGHLYKV